MNRMISGDLVRHMRTFEINMIIEEKKTLSNLRVFLLCNGKFVRETEVFKIGEKNES